MMDRLCYISRRYPNRTTAGNKAKCDYEDIITHLGAVNIGLQRSFGNGKVAAFFLNAAGVARCALSLRKGDVLFLQYPVKKYFVFLCRAAHAHGAKVVSLIHDLGSSRRKALTVQQEIDRLNHSDVVIASNNVMAQWLKDNGLKSKVCGLGFMSYLTDSRPVPRSASGQLTVCYAGALNRRKNSFIEKLSSIKHPFDMHIYGNLNELADSVEANPHLFAHGSKPSDDFIGDSDGDFGLVWDGDSLDACTGDFGEYLRLNTPHKCSFYIVAGKPLIVWKQSAMAPLVESLGLGFAINSLEEVQPLLKDISPEQLANMRGNVAKVAQSLTTGSNFTKILTECLKLTYVKI